MEQASNNVTNPAPHPANSSLLPIRVISILLGIPLACMEFRYLPGWLSDYSYGLMFRLGVTFGLVILIWYVDSLRGLGKVRSIAFFLASIGSALLANWLGHAVGGDHDIDIIVISGAIFLALSQKFILESSWIPTIVAMIAAPGLFYLVLIPIDKIVDSDTSLGKLIANYWPFFWQTGYFVGMFGVSAWLKKRAATDQAHQPK